MSTYCATKKRVETPCACDVGDGRVGPADPRNLGNKGEKLYGATKVCTATASGWGAGSVSTIVPRPVPGPVAPRGPYETIAESLRRQIDSGELKPGDQLPTVAQLAVANTVAVGTAHQALSMLKAEGLIEVTRSRRAVVRLGSTRRSK